jgi:hypothetical protein
MGEQSLDESYIYAYTLKDPSFAVMRLCTEHNLGHPGWCGPGFLSLLFGK